MNKIVIIQPDIASSRSDSWMTVIKNGMKIIVAGALLLAATNAVAGINFVQIGSQFTNPESAPVSVQQLDGDSIRIHTTGLNLELGLRGSDFPPEYGVPASAEGVLTLIQQMDLIIDLADGTVSGNASMDWSSPLLAATADVQGSASCVPLNGRGCGQLVLELELRGVLSDPYDPASIGNIRMEMLSSFTYDEAGLVRWAAMSANATLGLNEVMTGSLVEWLDILASD